MIDCRTTANQNGRPQKSGLYRISPRCEPQVWASPLRIIPGWARHFFTRPGEAREAKTKYLQPWADYGRFTLRKINVCHQRSSFNRSNLPALAGFRYAETIDNQIVQVQIDATAEARQRPPSMQITCPVIYDARSEARKPANSATSCALPMRFKIVRFKTASLYSAGRSSVI